MYIAKMPTTLIWAWRACGLPGRWPNGGLSEGYGHDGPGVCLGDGQAEAYLKDMAITGLVSVGRWPGGGLSDGYGHDGPRVCLGDDQAETYLTDMAMTGLVSAWAMTRRRPT